MSLPLEKDIDGQTLVRTSFKLLTYARVSSLVVTFFNRMNMGDYESKRHKYFRAKKGSGAKWEIRTKLEGIFALYSY